MDVSTPIIAGLIYFVPILGIGFHLLAMTAKESQKFFIFGCMLSVAAMAIYFAERNEFLPVVFEDTEWLTELYWLAIGLVPASGFAQYWKARGRAARLGGDGRNGKNRF